MRGHDQVESRAACDPQFAAALRDERGHFQYIEERSSQQFNAIRYLYDRLNIIDSKASTALRLNAMVLAIITFALRIEDAPLVGFLAGTIDNWIYLAMPLLAAIVTCLTISSIMCFALSRLSFDHVTGDGGELSRTFDDYRSLFFEITIDRQKRLARAQGFSRAAGGFALCFLVVLLGSPLFSAAVGLLIAVALLIVLLTAHQMIR